MKTKIAWDEFVEELKVAGLVHVFGDPDDNTTFINVCVKSSNLQKWTEVLHVSPIYQMRDIVKFLVDRYNGKPTSDGTKREIQFKKEDFP